MRKRIIQAGNVGEVMGRHLGSHLFHRLCYTVVAIIIALAFGVYRRATEQQSEPPVNIGLSKSETEDMMQSLTGHLQTMANKGRDVPLEGVSLEPIDKTAAAEAKALMWRGKHRASQGAEHEAETHLKESLVLMEQAYASSHPYVSDCHFSLGSLYQSMERYELAETHFKSALAMTEEVFGRGHRRTASRLIRLGQVYASVNDYASAEEAYQRALKIQQEAHGADHPDVKSTSSLLDALQNRSNDSDASSSTK